MINQSYNWLVVCLRNQSIGNWTHIHIQSISISFSLAGGSQPDRLQQVDVGVYSDSDCNNKLGSSNYIEPVMMCAGFDQGGKDSCQVGISLLKCCQIRASFGSVFRHFPKYPRGVNFHGILIKLPENLCILKWVKTQIFVHTIILGAAIFWGVKTLKFLPANNGPTILDNVK